MIELSRNLKVLLNFIKTYEGKIKLTGNGKYMAKVRFSNMVIVVHIYLKFYYKSKSKNINITIIMCH